MKKENFLYEGREMDFYYEPSWIGKEFDKLDGSGIEIARIEFKDAIFLTVSNGEKGEYWLEHVVYLDGVELEFSDCIHEIPKNKEEAKNDIIDMYGVRFDEILRGM